MAAASKSRFPLQHFKNKKIFLFLPEEDKEFVMGFEKALKSLGVIIMKNIDSNVQYFIARQRILKTANSSGLQNLCNVPSRSLTLLKKSMEQSVDLSYTKVVQTVKKLNITIIAFEKLYDYVFANTLRHRISKMSPSSVRLNPPFIKHEDNERLFRPNFARFQINFFPKISYVEGYKYSPFDSKRTALDTLSVKGTKTVVDVKTKDAKKRYRTCEICNIYYKDLEEHLKTKRHRNISKDKKMFIKLDNLTSNFSFLKLAKSGNSNINQQSMPSTSKLSTELEEASDNKSYPDFTIQPSPIFNPLDFQLDKLNNSFEPDHSSLGKLFSSSNSSSSSIRFNVCQALEVIDSGLVEEANRPKIQKIDNDQNHCINSPLTWLTSAHSYHGSQSRAFTCDRFSKVATIHDNQASIPSTSVHNQYNFNSPIQMITKTNTSLGDTKSKDISNELGFSTSYMTGNTIDSQSRAFTCDQFSKVATTHNDQASIPSTSVDNQYNFNSPFQMTTKSNTSLGDTKSNDISNELGFSTSYMTGNTIDSHLIGISSNKNLNESAPFSLPRTEPTSSLSNRHSYLTDFNVNSTPKVSNLQSRNLFQNENQDKLNRTIEMPVDDVQISRDKIESTTGNSYFYSCSKVSDNGLKLQFKRIKN